MAVYRVHWLKAKSRRDRWREERILLASEMEWTELFFRHRARLWKDLAAEVSPIESPASTRGDSEFEQTAGSAIPSETGIHRSSGHICYALKLESMWNRLAQQAVVQFGAVKSPTRSSQHSTRSRSSSSLSQLSS
jgi:hypothetical protein